MFRVKSVEGSAYGRSVGRSSTMSRVMTASTFSHIYLLTQLNLFLFLDYDVILLNRTSIKGG